MLGKLKFLFPDRDFNDACRYIFKFVNKGIDETFLHLKGEGKVTSQKAERLVFIRELARQTNDRELIAFQVLNVLNAANDGAAIVISHMLFFLSRYTEVQRKLRDEVAVIEGNIPEYDELKNMK